MIAGISEIVMQSLSLEDFFVRARKAGYDAVELCLGGNCPLQLENADQLVPQINALSAFYQLPVVSLVHWQCTGNLLDSGEKQRVSIEQTCRGLEIARQLGAAVSLHTLGVLSPRLYYQDAYKNALCALKAIAPAAEKTGVALAVEFVWNGFLFSPLEMRRLLDAVNSPAVGFYFDPGNMAIFQYPQHWVRALGKHIKAMHMKDWSSHLLDGSWQTGRGGNVLNGEWTALLQGDVDFRVLMEELKACGYQGPMISEVDTFLASIEQTRAAMREIMQG